MQDVAPAPFAERLETLRACGAAGVVVGVFDIDGILRGKTVSFEKFDSLLAGGLSFCDVIFGWDVGDTLYPAVPITGWHSGYPDAQVDLAPGTLRAIPPEPAMPLVLGSMAGAHAAVCPRALLGRLAERAARRGFVVRAGAEFEFFVYRETPHSLEAKGYHELVPFTPGAFGYSVLRRTVESSFHDGLMAFCGQAELPLEGLHTESGAGVIEAALAPAELIEAADRAALFKTLAKAFCQRRELVATFMAKCSPTWPGQSGHLHLSLCDPATGANLFRDEAAPEGMSETQRWFVGGQQKLLPELLAMAAPTVNSYTRLIPGFWAPTWASWGVENRTAAIRVVAGATSQRVEYRVAGADINPYIAFAAALGSGLWGIENRIEPTAPAVGSAYAGEPPAALRFPRRLGEAAARLRASEAAADLFGAEFVEHFATTREWEQEQADRAITDWQLRRYFETV